MSDHRSELAANDPDVFAAVVGGDVPGGAGFDPDQPVTVTVTMGAADRCATGISP